MHKIVKGQMKKRRKNSLTKVQKAKLNRCYNVAGVTAFRFVARICALQLVPILDYSISSAIPVDLTGVCHFSFAFKLNAGKFKMFKVVMV